MALEAATRTSAVGVLLEGDALQRLLSPYDGTYAGHHVNRSWTTEKVLPAKDVDWVLVSLGNGWVLNKFQT